MEGKNRVCGYGLDLSGSGEGPVAGFHKDENGVREFFAQLSDCHFLKQDSALWI
jgi:hypothetical protein